jgi:hypothetical protein
MDPFIEAQEWEGFHSRFVPILSDALVPRVRPRYVVKVQSRVYVQRVFEGFEDVRKPDLAVLREEGPLQGVSPSAGAASSSPSPVQCAVPISEEKRELFLTIRERESFEVVTVIELLSPSNKRRNSDGRSEYLLKRDQILRSPAHLVELDLLRGGARLPTLGALPAGDYYAFVHRRQSRPNADVYPWSIRQALPRIPVPLSGEDPDATIDLEECFSTTYTRAGYDYSLDYDRLVEPPLNENDLSWVKARLQAWKDAR